MYNILKSIRKGGGAACTLAALTALTPTTTLAQATVFAEGLTNPSGIYVDDDGYLWVTSEGTGNDDAGVSVITPDGVVHPFITGLPSTMVDEGPSGAHHVYFNNDVELLIVQGEGTGDLSESILLVDTTGFTPGDDPLGPSDIDAVYNLGDFVDGALGEGSNPFALTFVPRSDLVFVSDSKANAIVQGEDGVLSILTQLPDVPNSGTTGPPMVDAVPTGIDYQEGKLLVATLTGFPFNEGAASIFAIDTLGSVTKLIGDLTTVVDVQGIPGGGIVFLEHRFGTDAGALYKFKDGELTELATGLDQPVGLRIGHRGEVYVSLLVKGQIVVVEGVVTAAEQELPDRVRPMLVQAYPNPFVEGVNLAVNVEEAGSGNLTIVDVLGRTVYSQDFSRLEAGTQRLRWDTDTSERLSPGTYLYRVEVAGSVANGVVVKQ
ncbi:MAG: ScyD/ScyE family protein [Rhodothermales bacterium]